MSTASIFLLVAAAVMVLSNFVDVKSIFANFNKDKDKDVIDTNNTIPTNIPAGTVKVYQVVQQWEHLKDMCQSCGLTESVKALDDMFSTLSKGKK